MRLELRFLSFHARASPPSSCLQNVLSLPVHRLINLITTAIPLPKGVKIDKGVSAPHVTVDVQSFIEQQVSGLTLDEFYLFEGDLVAVATLHTFRTRPTKPH